MGQAHNSVAAFAQAYNLGEKESAAAVNLLTSIPPTIKEGLTELVRTLGSIDFHNLSYFEPPILGYPEHLYRKFVVTQVFYFSPCNPVCIFPHPPIAFLSPRIYGQPRFINHDGIAEGLLNLGHTTAVGFLLPWRNALSNSHGLLTLMLSRMELDFVATSPKLRKPWGLKDLDPWQTFRTILSGR